MGNNKDVTVYIERNNLWYHSAPVEVYQSLAMSVLRAHTKAVDDILIKGQKGKIMFLVGQMLKQSTDGEIEPKLAEQAIIDLLEQKRTQS